MTLETAPAKPSLQQLVLEVRNIRQHNSAIRARAHLDAEPIAYFVPRGKVRVLHVPFKYKLTRLPRLKMLDQLFWGLKKQNVRVQHENPPRSAEYGQVHYAARARLRISEPQAIGICRECVGDYRIRRSPVDDGRVRKNLEDLLTRGARY